MLSNKKLVAICATVFCCNVALLVLFMKYKSDERCYATIDENQKVNTILPDNFLSIGIDASEIQDYDKIDFTSLKLRELAAALAPAHLRLGGTMSERLIFSKNDLITCEKPCPKDTHSKPCSYIKKLCKHKVLPFFVMTGSKWSSINEFCKATNLRLLFTFNVLLRDEHGWNEHNAKELLEYSTHRQYEADWQLGNEPNSFLHIFNESLTPKVLAHDFERLRKLLNRTGYKKSLLVGPDTTRPQSSCPKCLNYMVEFLEHAAQTIDVRSWHQYYLNSKTATLEDFWNPDTLDLLKQQIETMKTHTAKYQHIPMWLTETSSSYGGGAPGISNTYAGSPLWVDKLGLASKYNITTVVRQSFIGKNYGLLSEDLNPLPDWWISVIYKKVVGNKVLNIECTCSRYQRMYAHCANRNYTNDTSAITVYALNLEMKKALFILNGTALEGYNLTIDEFMFSAPSNNRQTQTVLLNGWPLYYESPLPDLQPRLIKFGTRISMPPYSIGFWVIKNTSIEACK